MVSTLNLVPNQILIQLVVQCTCEKNEFETILTPNDVMNIQYGIGKGVCLYTKIIFYESKCLFWLYIEKQTTRNTQQWTCKYRFELYSYIQTCCYPENLTHIRKPGKSGQEEMYYSKCINSKYIFLLVMKHVKN